MDTLDPLRSAKADTAYQEELALTRQAVAGDREAFGKLYDRYIDTLFRYCTYRMGAADPRKVQDVVSEVFTRALAALPKYRPEKPLLALLYTIASNVISDQGRSAHNRRAAPEGEQRTQSSPDLTFAPEKAGEDKALQLELLAALQALTPLQQNVITLRFIEERSYAEVAEIVHKPESTIRGIQMRALEALKVELTKQAGRKKEDDE